MLRRTKNRHVESYGVVIGTRLTIARGEAFRRAAQLQNKTSSQLLSEIVWGYLEEFAAVNNPQILLTKLEHVQLRLNELVAFSRAEKTSKMVEKVAQYPGKTILTQAYESRQEKRGKMLEKGLNTFDELYEIAKSEAMANQSRARMHAYMVMAKLGALNALLMRDASDEEILLGVIQIEELAQQNRKMLKEMKEAKKQENQQ